jgi:hypothetical protein
VFDSSTGPACRGRSFWIPLAITVLLLFSHPVRAQDPPPAAARVRNWSFEVVSGPSVGGPNDDLEEAMRSAGFDDTSTGGWFGTGGHSYPSSSDELWDRVAYWGAVRHRVGNGPWHVGLGGGPSEFGTVSGYQQTVGNTFVGTYVDARCRIATLASMAWYDVAPALRVGAGPAIHRVDLDVGYAGIWGEGSTRSWNGGFVLEAALTVPADTPVFFVALAQYRWAGSATTGTWQGRSNSGVHAELPAMSVRVSHAFVALGIGGRF